MKSRGRKVVKAKTRNLAPKIRAERKPFTDEDVKILANIAARSDIYEYASCPMFWKKLMPLRAMKPLRNRDPVSLINKLQVLKESRLTKAGVSRNAAARLMRAMVPSTIPWRRKKNIPFQEKMKAALDKILQNESLDDDSASDSQVDSPPKKATKEPEKPPPEAEHPFLSTPTSERETLVPPSNSPPLIIWQRQKPSKTKTKNLKQNGRKLPNNTEDDDCIIIKHIQRRIH